jgi:hypothetical protein
VFTLLTAFHIAIQQTDEPPDTEKQQEDES